MLQPVDHRILATQLAQFEESDKRDVPSDALRAVTLMFIYEALRRPRNQLRDDVREGQQVVIEDRRMAGLF